jgi:hypothetical protein
MVEITAELAALEKEKLSLDTDTMDELLARAGGVLEIKHPTDVDSTGVY